MRKHAVTAQYTPLAAGEKLSEAFMLPLLEGFNTTLALRCLSDGFRVIDAAHGYFAVCHEDVNLSMRSHAGASSFMQDASEQNFRFFNCEMFFSPRNLNILLRALHGTTKRNRKMFFKHALSCRRRAAKRWLDSSVAKIFTLDDQFSMLKHRAMSFRLISAIQKTGLSLHDAFNKFDFDKNGLLSPGEIWGAFEYLHIVLSATDVLDFVSSADIDRDGNVSMKELALALEDPEKAEKERKRLEQTENELFVSRSCPTLTVGTSAPKQSLIGDTQLDGVDGGNEMDIVLNTDDVSPSLVDGDHDEDDKDVWLPQPTQLQRNLTGNSVGSWFGSADSVVLPKGEEVLRELLTRLTKEEEDAEARENAAEIEQERSIQREIEVEEEENDRLQDGGPNPCVTGIRLLRIFFHI